jgi:hypothetical protein
MRDNEKDNINRIFKNKKLKWCGNFLGDDNGLGEDCYELLFQIKDIKPLISVGESYDYAIVDIILFLKEHHFLSKIIGYNKKESINTLNFLLHLKHKLQNTISKVIKPMSDLRVTINDIIPVIVDETENINEGKINRSVIRDVIRDIINVVKKDLHATKVFKLGKYGEDENAFIVLVRQNLSDDNDLLLPLDVTGYWDDDKNTVEVEIDIDENAGNEVLYNLIGELNDVVSHELEHKKQYLDDYDFPDKEYKQPLRYYTQPHEIEAQLAGFKRLAKLQKRTLDDVMMDFFQKRKKKYNLSNTTIKKIIGRIKEYGQV